MRITAAAFAAAALLLCICCICCCCCLWGCPVLPPAAFAAAAVIAALPTSCSCSGCCPSCAQHPMFHLKERNNVFRNTNSCSTCSLSSKRHCIENRKVLLPCSACCIKREVSEDKTKERGKRGPPEQAGCRAGIRRREERGRRRCKADLERRRASSAGQGPARLHARGSAAGCCSTASAAAAFFGRPISSSRLPERGSFQPDL